MQIPPMGRPAHQTTTRHLGAAYPFATEPGLGEGGVLIGRDLIGGAFSYDPFRFYNAGLLTNPNMVVIGQIGRGKSAFVKSYLWRQSTLGRQRVGHRSERRVRGSCRGMGSEALGAQAGWEPTAQSA